MTSSSFTWDSIKHRPATKLGWWALGFAIASFVLNFAWTILPGGAWASLICGLIAGVLALIAILRQQVRSCLVLLCVLDLVGVVFFFLGEFLMPH